MVLFFERTFPNANMVLIKDEFPILVDTGFGTNCHYTLPAANQGMDGAE